jgi:hypothetical protein
MLQRDRIHPLSGFQHINRSLEPGERIPSMPSLMQQLEAYQVDLVRYSERAALEAEPLPDLALEDEDLESECDELELEDAF